MDNRLNLIKIYFFVCDAYENVLKYSVQRFSNNRHPAFTDQEIMTIMLYCIAYEKRNRISEIHSFARSWLKDWFPGLPSYSRFDRRVNRLSEAFRILLEIVLDNHMPQNISQTFRVVDSMPIITCSSKRSGKVAPSITDKGYCSTKSLYYYGVKLHVLATPSKGRLPVPQSVIVTPASESDIAVFRDNWSRSEGTVVFADKAYRDKGLAERMLKNDSELLTPVKYPRGFPERLKQMYKAADDLYSRAVSSIRQPIESLFGWLLEKSDIQRASRVRSDKGLLTHIFTKLAAVFLTLALNSN